MTATTSTNYDLEQGVYSGMPSLVGKAMGPARQWFSSALEWVCGDPEQLRTTGEQYVQLGHSVSTLSVDLQELVSGVPTWQGPAAVTFRSTMSEAVELVDKVGGFVGRTNEILVAAAEVAVEAANLIWDIVVELVKWLVTTLMKAMAASTFSFGASIAAWLASAIGQVCTVVTKIAQVVGKVGSLLMKIVQLLQKLATVIAKYKVVLDKIQQVLSKVKQLSERFGQLSDRADQVPGGGSWDDYKRTGGASDLRGIGAGTNGSSFAGRAIGGGLPAWQPGSNGAHDGTGGVSRPGQPATPDWQYEGGYDRTPDGTGGVSRPGQPATPDWQYEGGYDRTADGTVGDGAVGDGAVGDGVGNWEYGGIPDDPDSTSVQGVGDGTGGHGLNGWSGLGDADGTEGGIGPAGGSDRRLDLSGSGRSAVPEPEGTQTAGLTGGVGGGVTGGGLGVGGGVHGGPGASGTMAAGVTPRGAGLTGGVGGVPGAGMAAMPMAPASGGSSHQSSSRNNNTAGPGVAPLGAGLGKDKEKPKPDRGRGPLQNVRIGEEDGSQSAGDGQSEDARS